MALIVPNLKWYRGLQGGLAGGIFGRLGFMLISWLMGELGGRLLGAAILGFFIGVMIALAEMVFRRFWLELAFSAREIRTVTLGTAAVSIGGDEQLASVFVQGVRAAGATAWRASTCCVRIWPAARNMRCRLATADRWAT